MSKKALSRRGFLSVTGKTAVATVLSSLLKIVPEAQGVLAAGATDGVILPGGVQATPLSSRELNRVYNRLFKTPDVQTLAQHLTASGYSARRERASAYTFTLKDNSQAVGLLIPFSDTNEAYLIIADFGSTIRVGGGVKYSQNDRQLIDLYDVKEGNLIKQSIAYQDLNSTLLVSVNGGAGSIGIQSSSSCNICSFVCGFIKGTGCSLGGAVVCGLLAVPCGPIYPECWLICMAIFLIVCYNFPKPCYDICRESGYCP
jgi:hypothetical protein